MASPGPPCRTDSDHIKKDRAQRIRELNDALRRTFSGGRVLVTRSFAALPAEMQAQALEAIRTFDQFDADNDPWGEHDFGSVQVGAERVLWKIDYYDLLFIGASPDPVDPSVTARVLTVMLADDY